MSCNLFAVEGLKYCENYQNVTQRHEVNKCCWKNGANRLAQCRVAKNLQFVKNTISAKYNKLKFNKMRSACNRQILGLLDKSMKEEE